jgi:hypothetical protein
LISLSGPFPALKYSSTVPGTETARPAASDSHPPLGGFTGNFVTSTGGKNNSSPSHFASLSSHSFHPSPDKSISVRSAAPLVKIGARHKTKVEKTIARKSRENFTQQM